MSANVSLFAAFVAGLLSISSPCVLPLVPVYLAHLAGAPAGGGESPRRRVLGNALAYVAGFSLVFVLLGVALGAAGGLVATASIVAGHRDWLVRVGGVLLLVLGAHQLGIVRIPWLDRDRRIVPGDRRPNGRLASSFLVGITFAAGWTPCVGPILGAILTMAMGQGSAERAALLLSLYSAGLAVPFLLAAVAFGASGRWIKRLNAHLPLLTGLSGGVMLAVGAVMLLGLYQQFFARVVALAPWTPWEPGL